LFKNSQGFGKKCQKTAGGGIFLTHTVVLGGEAETRHYCCWWPHGQQHCQDNVAV